MILSDAHSVGGNKRQSRTRCLASTSLCSAALVATLMTISVARAADRIPPFNNLSNNINDNSLPKIDNLLVNMQGGNDTYGVSGKITATQDLVAVGGAGIDRFVILDTGQLTIGGTSQFQSTERLVNAGTFNTGALTYNGTLGSDLIDNAGIITVTGPATFNTGAGNDTFNTQAGSRLTATGTISLDGGSGLDELINGGRIEAIGPTSNLEISGYETVNNSFVLKAGGDFVYNGTAGNDRFENSGIVYAGSNASFTFGDGDDRFVNTGQVDVKGNALFDGGAGDDRFANSGDIDVDGNAVFNAGDGNDAFGNSGRIDVGGNAQFDGGNGTGDTFTNTASGTITVDGQLLIKRYETVRNDGAITANNGFAYSGSGSTDTFANEDDGVIKVTAGNATMDGLGGTDGFTNDGDFIVTGGGNLTVDNIETVRNTGVISSEGDASFDGGVAGTLFRNDGFVDADRNLTIDNFATTVNLGRLDTGGSLTYGGTAGNNGFGNGGLIRVTGGNAEFHGEGGIDSLNNSGVIKVTGAGSTLIVDGMENVSNSGTILSVGPATFSGGAAGGTFDNSGTLTATTGLLTVSGYATTTNTGTINASVGFDYSGNAGVNAFNNVGGGTITVANGNAVLNGGNGADTFDNRGTFRVTGLGNDLSILNIETVANRGTITSLGDALFQGGAAGVRFDNFGTLGAADTLTIANFLTAINTNTINAGTLNYQGSGGNNVFGNGQTGVITVDGDVNFNSGTGDDSVINAGGMGIAGTAAFDGGGGAADAFTNRASGTMVVAGETQFSNFETVTNNGTLLANGGLRQTGVATDSFVNGGTVRLTGNASLVGNLVNTGLFNMTSRDVRDEIGQIVRVGGNLNNAGGSTFSMDVNLAENGAQPPSADHIVVAGNSSGPMRLILANRFDNSDPAQRLGLFNRLDLLSSGSGNVSVTTGNVAGATDPFDVVTVGNGQTREFYDFGFIDYEITNNNGDVFISSNLNEAEAGGVVGGISSTVSAISAVFHKPQSAFVGSCKPNNDGTGFGSWGRTAGGSVDTSISGSFNVPGGGNGQLTSKNSTDFTGLQGGFDTQLCNIGNSNAVLHGGVTVGNLRGNSTQTNGGLDVDFNSYFVGTYGALISGNFSADVLLRYDSHDFDLSHQNDEIIAGVQSTSGSTISGMAAAAYRFRLSDNLTYIASSGVTLSRTSVDGIEVNGGSPIDFKDLNGIIGYAGGQMQLTHQLTDNVVLLPFVSANVYRDFGDGGQARLRVGAANVNMETGTVGTFGQLGIGTNVYVAGGEKPTEPYILGGARFDAQFGEKLEGWAVTGNLRLQF